MSLVIEDRAVGKAIFVLKIIHLLIRYLKGWITWDILLIEAGSRSSGLCLAM